MFIDIEARPRMTGAYKEREIVIKFFTDKGAEKYNEYFGTEYKKGDSFITDKSYKELVNVADILGLTMIYG